MKRKAVIKTTKIVACAVLSVLFVLILVVAPFYYSITALTEPETVAMVIQEVDYVRVITESTTVKKSLAKYGITPSEADKVMKSKKTGELIEAYADEVTQVLLDIPEDKVIDVAFIKQVTDENTEKFIDIAEKNTTFKFKKEKVQKTVDTFFKKNEVAIQKSIPVIKEVKNVVRTIHTSRLIKKDVSLLVAIIITMVIFLIMGVIIFLRRSNGFFWIGIDFAITSIILCLIIAFSKSNAISRMAFKISNFGIGVVESAVTVSAEKIIIVVFGTIIMTILFFGFFVLLKVLKRKYRGIPTLKELINH